MEVRKSVIKESKEVFDERHVIEKLKHYLPAQATLKDFIHHNTLHSFQEYNFYDAQQRAAKLFGYKTRLSLPEYRRLFLKGSIKEDILNKILEKKGVEKEVWKNKLLNEEYPVTPPRIGQIRSCWKNIYKLDMNNLVHPLLFRIAGNFVDQGVAIWNFPISEKGLIASLKEMEVKSFGSLFKSKRARHLLLSGQSSLEKLLEILIGNKSLYEQYLFDQQFEHPGWSGMYATIEENPDTLWEKRKVSLKELIVLELLIEIDVLDYYLKDNWKPLCHSITKNLESLFAPTIACEEDELLSIWQEAYEWSYYDEVLASVTLSNATSKEVKNKSFQALFCIDDREISLRDYLESIDTKCETYGTPGFFGVEFYYQAENGKFLTKQCPAPVTPKHLIKESGGDEKEQNDVHFAPSTHSLIWGWIITHTLGLFSVIKLFLNIFRPSVGPAVYYSFHHMDSNADLVFENTDPTFKENGLQIGFTTDEMVQRVENTLMSIGLVDHFAPLVYVIGHGASSVNNPHYAAYDCGACSGRPGSVNARVFSLMANHPLVREKLKEKGLEIPIVTQFIGGLHDTTRDEICFYDEDKLYLFNQDLHQKNKTVFYNALDFNAKERSRRFDSIKTNESPENIHRHILRRSVSLFEPRPELNHATNALCVVGRRKVTENLFLDRRSFLNSYDYRIDPEGNYLFNILKAAAPVCGGINLEYFFSRTDNQKLGSGSKLPHNVIGLIGVANGTDGDLRPGLPCQMIEVHDPIRLLILVEHYPEVVLKTIQRSNETYEWFANEWIHLAVVNPQNHEISYFQNEKFIKYSPLTKVVNTVKDRMDLIEKSDSLQTIPVHLNN